MNNNTSDTHTNLPLVHVIPSVLLKKTITRRRPTEIVTERDDPNRLSFGSRIRSMFNQRLSRSNNGIGGHKKMKRVTRRQVNKKKIITK